jgi:RluA family pseudouridine synthase
MTKAKKTNTRFLPKGLNVLFEDKDILVVEKPVGLLTVSTEREKSKTAYAHLMDYVKKGAERSRNRIYVVHRLDRDTSGILVFAKNEMAKNNLQENWENFHKTYFAVTHGIWESKEGIITSYLTENKAQFVHSTKDSQLGKLSKTGYKIIQESYKFSLVEVSLLTGRKNQIRAHFSENNHPIVGDQKYGKEKAKYPRMALHSFSIEFIHPILGKKMQIESKVPQFFFNLLGVHETGI